MDWKKYFAEIGVIDGHLHLYDWQDRKTGEHFLHALEEYKEKMQLRAFNIAALPAGKNRDASNNMLIAFYKLANPAAYAHGGLIYTEYPPTATGENRKEPLTQYEELMAIGFDGIKMLEGKPNLYKMVNTPLDSDYYDAFFARAEQDKTHILAHINDPEEFWDDDWASDELKAKGWFYGDGTYIKNTEMYAQIDRLMEKHPNLTATFAHFFFHSASPEVLEEMFAKYPNMAVDLTPGSEMYVNFNKRPEYYKEFFRRYADRIVFGTDGCFPKNMDAMEWLCDRVFRYVATDDATDAWGDTPLHGICLDRANVERIMVGNFVAKVGAAPKPINKEALKHYIEKYKSNIGNEATRREVERLAEEWL
ncbi:MAG: amidohydrolase family protein [Clostridia bacterium]|nr:amidohydrolase family protein [Clostridia bacterium]